MLEGFQKQIGSDRTRISKLEAKPIEITLWSRKIKIDKNDQSLRDLCNITKCINKGIIIIISDGEETEKWEEIMAKNFQI